MAPRTPPAAPGFRAMPSQAAAAILPWPSPPPNAATATPKPTARTSVVVLIGALIRGGRALRERCRCDQHDHHQQHAYCCCFLHFYCLLRELPPGGGSRTPCSRAHTDGYKLELQTRRLVLVGSGQPDVHGRQNREDVRLNDRNENVQPDEQDRDERRQNPRARRRWPDASSIPQAPAPRTIPKTIHKSDRSRKCSPTAGRSARATARIVLRISTGKISGTSHQSSPPVKCLHIPDRAVMPNALPVEIAEHDHRARQRHRDLRRRRRKPWEHSEKVRQQNKQRNRSDQRHILAPVMARIFRKNVVDAEVSRIGKQQLRDLLRRSRILHRQPRSHQQREHAYRQPTPECPCKRVRESEDQGGSAECATRGAARAPHRQVRDSRSRDPAYVLFHAFCARLRGSLVSRSRLRSIELLSSCVSVIAGCQSSYTLAAIAAAPKANKPKTILTRGMADNLKIT